MMKKEIADKWVAALRSGEYTQGYGHLKGATNEGGSHYCCLGVLCEISGAGEWDEKPTFVSPFGEAIFGYEVGGEMDSNLIPESVREWSGMRNENGMVDPSTAPEGWPIHPYSGGHMSLADMNDSGAHTFKGIASVIEKYYEYL